MCLKFSSYQCKIIKSQKNTPHHPCLKWQQGFGWKIDWDVFVWLPKRFYWGYRICKQEM